MNNGNLPVIPGQGGGGNGGGSSFDPSTFTQVRSLKRSDTLLAVQGGVAKLITNLDFLKSRLISDGLILGYDLTEASGTTLNDFSGNNLNATFNGTTNPTWVTGGSGGLRFNGSQYVPLPPQFNAAKTIQVFVTNQSLAEWINQSNSGIGNPTLINPMSNGSPAFVTWFDGPGSGATLTPGAYGANGGGFTTKESASGPNLLTWTLGSSTSDPDRVWINNYKIPLTDMSSSTAFNAGKMAGPYYSLGGGTAYTGCYFGGVAYFIVGYNRVLTDAEIVANEAAIAAVMRDRGVVAENYKAGTGNPTNRIIACGDSITQFGDYWNGTYDLGHVPTSYGVSGAKAVAYRQFFKRDVLALLNTGSLSNIMSSLLLTNDVQSTAVSIPAYLGAFGEAKELYPGNTKTIIGTIPSRTGFDTHKNTSNNAIRQAAFLQGHELADFGSIPEIGADGASTNTAWFDGPGIHPTYGPTNTGQSLMKKVYSDTVNYAVADPETPYFITTATYQILAKDRWVIYTGPSGGNITLPPATGHTKKRRVIQNASVNPVTLTALTQYNELINGATTFSLAAGQSITIRSVLRGQSTGGCDWRIVT